MLCDYKVLRESELKKDVWMGGTTTQLAIYPKNALYKDRQFTWRLSSATVDLDESEFTSLPDYNRILMILRGKIELNHNDTEIVYLNDFDQNEFDGSNHTISKGRAVDFNLMMRKDKCVGRVKCETVQKQSQKLVTEINGFYDFDNFTLALYNFDGVTEISVNENTTETLNKGDLLIVNFKEQISSLQIAYNNICDNDSKVIVSQIFY